MAGVPRDGEGADGDKSHGLQRERHSSDPSPPPPSLPALASPPPSSFPTYSSTSTTTTSSSSSAMVAAAAAAPPPTARSSAPRSPALALPAVDRDWCVKMALVHDLAESVVGDIAPSCGVAVEEKHARERRTMEYLQDVVARAGGPGRDMLLLWEEYNAGLSPEAKLVKDLDRIDMALQAFEYEQVARRPGELQSFFKSVQGKLHYPALQHVFAELLTLRGALAADSAK